MEKENDIYYFKSKPNIALITPYLDYFGGVEIVNHSLIKLLNEERFKVQVISQELFKNNIIFKYKKRFLGLNNLLSKYFNRYASEDTDLVICNGEFSLGIDHPLAINIFHGCYYGYAQALKSFISERAFVGLMKLANEQKEGANGKYIIAVSSNLKEILELQGIKVDRVIPNAIDTELFRPIEGIKRNNKCLFVGSSDYYGKGIDILEELADRNIKIDCITTFPPKNKRLKWLGNIPSRELPRYYSSYKFFIFPSRFEGCGLVSLEAMACGTPIVMTSVGVGPEIAKEIPDFVVDNKSDKISLDIIKKIKKIERNYNYFSIQARNYILKHHDLEKWKKSWLNTIDLVINRKE